MSSIFYQKNFVAIAYCGQIFEWLFQKLDIAETKNESKISIFRNPVR